MKHLISGSGGLSLQFPKGAAYADYMANTLILDIQTYAKQRDAFGVWASNQNKFVDSREDFNNWDGRYMENMYHILKEHKLI
jgi:hypothetical protein